MLYVGNSGAYYASLETVSPSLAGLIVFTYPALVAVVTLRFGQRLEGRRAWLALGIALVGVALTIGGIDPNDAPPVTGLLLVVTSMLIYVVWIVLAARLAGERRDTVGGLSDSGAAASTATALMMTATAAVYWSWSLLGARPVLPAQIPAAGVGRPRGASGWSRRSSRSRPSTPAPSASVPRRHRSSARSNRSGRSRSPSCCSASR